MKRIFVAVLGLLVLCSGASAQNDYVYTDAGSLPLYGKLCDDTFEPFSRLPLSMKDSVRDAVWRLGRSSAGLFVRFTSDAGKFDFRWESVFRTNLTNMAPVGVRGLALYVLDNGRWMFVASQRPDADKSESSSKVTASRLAGTQREYMLYLSLYDGVRNLRIGVPPGCRVKPSAMDSPRSANPIVIYGTSILQGASASHPGMCGTAQLSRRTDRVVINLGFSGNCRLEEPIARYMASYPDPGMYIIDNWNGPASVAEKGLEKCLRILRAAHPAVPVLVVDRPLKPIALFDDESASLLEARSGVAASVVAKMQKEGDGNIFHLSPSVLGEGNSGTIDGTHFTDEAFTRWVDAICPYVMEYLK